MSIQNNRLHGMFRKWRISDHNQTKLFLILQQHIYTPQNYFSDDDLNEISIIINGQIHGLSYRYDYDDERYGHACDQKYFHYGKIHGYFAYYNEIGEVISASQYRNGHQHGWIVNSGGRQLFHDGYQIMGCDSTLYLGLYLLCRDGYIICHDDKVNRFLTFFDRLPPELAELLLSKLTDNRHIHVHINKFFTLIGINTCCILVMTVSHIHNTHIHTTLFCMSQRHIMLHSSNIISTKTNLCMLST